MEAQKLANPGPLGLMGFGMTTVLLNIHNAGFSPVTTAIVAMGIFEKDEEKLVILIQVSPDASPDFEQIKKKIRTAVSHATGVFPEVNFTQMPLLLTASGKLARSKTKEAFLNKQIVLI